MATTPGPALVPDDAPMVPTGALRDGFAGQRMFVLPQQAVRDALARPVTSRLLVTDAGFFPHATRHGMARPGGARQHILLVCSSGSGWCTMPDGRHTVRRGDVLHIPAGTPHEYGASEADPWTLWWFHVVGTDASDLVEAARLSAGGPVSHLRDATSVASLVSQVVDALDAGTSGGLVHAAGAAWYALTLVIAAGRRPRGQAADPVEQVVEHLRSTTPRRTSVETLATMVGLSESHLSALFRQHVGVPPLRYQRDLRMARARELLDSTDLPVARIAHACGYDDPLYFSRQFARAHGLSPTEHRRRSI